MNHTEEELAELDEISNCSGRPPGIPTSGPMRRPISIFIG